MGFDVVGWRRCLILIVWSFVAVPGAVWGARIVLHDGRVLDGALTDVATIAPKPGAADDGPREIHVCDDGLRRTWVGERAIREITPGDVGEPPERIVLEFSRPQRSGREIVALGNVLNSTPFDDFGRRQLRVVGPNGRPLDLIQGITQVTPLWTRVDIVEVVDGTLHKWDMRLGTSTFSNERLAAILRNPGRGIDKNLAKRLQVARLFLQADRLRSARSEIESILRDFPDEGSRFQDTLRLIRQLTARQVLEELRLRQSSGQFQAARRFLEEFPTEDVAGDVLFEVRERLATLDEGQKSLAEFRERLKTHEIAIADEAIRGQLHGVVEEMLTQSTPSTLERLAPFLRLADDESLSHETRLALAVSGWIMGPNETSQDLPLALSAVRVQGLVRRYLVSETDEEREGILASLESESAGAPKYVASVLANMPPPVPPPPPEAALSPGHFRFEVPGIAADVPPVEYEVQIPPEYDPRRRYPAVVTLPALSTTPSLQLDWWAGGSEEDRARHGEAMRHGYVVIGVNWSLPGQNGYGYGAREHHAVLACLRDACRRISIDTDRVFLSGHASGADAAWDIGLAHPDLWAGVIPIGGRSRAYTQHYRENAIGLPLYFVCGQYAGDSLLGNAPDYDQFLVHAGYDATVVEYLGRGNDHFQEEIKRIFDWMGRKRRTEFPREFDAVSMRPWDNFFWWLEVDGIPEKSIVLPDNWPKRGARAAHLKGRILATNGVSVSAGSRSAVAWLSPEIVDFSKPVSFQFNGRRSSVASLEPDLKTLLEDARRRADRIHPFWVKVEL